MTNAPNKLGDEALAAIRRAANELAARRGLRCGLAGIGLVALGLALGSGSALSIPLVAGGAILAAAGLLGPRLSGRLAIEWGASGTVIDLHAAVAPPGTVASERVRRLPPAAEPTETIEAKGETIEIEISRLTSLLEARKKAVEDSSTA